MDNSNVTELVDVDNVYEANNYLDLGWKLVMGYAEGRFVDGAPTQTPHLVLGWTDGEPQYPQENEDNRRWL